MTSDENGSRVWSAIRDQLEASGIDLGELCCDPDETPPRVKVVCVNTDMGESLRELGQKTRDQVVMVRVDSDTCTKLDQWVATGVAKSRSEAAALFIREGLNVRNGELKKLSGALRELEKAKKKLHREAMEILGEGGPNEDKE